MPNINPEKVSALVFRKNLGEFLNRVNLKDDVFIIERSGKPLAVLCSIERFRKTGIVKVD